MRFTWLDCKILSLMARLRVLAGRPTDAAMSFRGAAGLIL